MERPLVNIEKCHIDERDVLIGRGVRSYRHEGNKRFQGMLMNRFEQYQLATTYQGKMELCLGIVSEWRQKNGRFLIWNQDTEKWDDIGDHKASNKTYKAYKTYQEFWDEINRRHGHGHGQVKKDTETRDDIVDHKASNETCQRSCDEIYRRRRRSTDAEINDRFFPLNRIRIVCLGKQPQRWQNDDAEINERFFASNLVCNDAEINDRFFHCNTARIVYFGRQIHPS